MTKKLMYGDMFGGMTDLLKNFDLDTEISKNDDGEKYTMRSRLNKKK